MKSIFFLFALIFSVNLLKADGGDTIYEGVDLSEEFILFMPNAFSPNGDGRNDYFAPVGIGITLDYFEMRIYNRQGNLVYLSTDINKPWDGNITENVMTKHQRKCLFIILQLEHPKVQNGNILLCCTITITHESF